MNKNQLLTAVTYYAKKYGVAVALFVFGYHLNAEVYEWGPFWNEGSIFYRDDWSMDPVHQVVTARWLMIIGSVVWIGTHFGIFSRLGRRNDE